MKVQKFRSVGILLALAATTALTVGCGGSGSSSKKSSASTAAGVTSNQNSLASLPEARASHTAVLLPSGEILVAGGLDVSGQPMDTTFLVTTTAVTRGPSLATPRTQHRSVALQNGQILFIGGHSDAQGVDVLASTEIYDPTTGSILPGPDMSVARASHAALNYVSGGGEFVLVAGGVAAVNTQSGVAPALASVEIYDATTNSFATLAGGLAEAQSGAHLVRLDTNDLLLVGGQGSTAPASPTVFDPTSQTFTASPTIVARAGVAVASKGREVLVAGGMNDQGLLEDTTEVFDSATSTFSSGRTLAEARWNSTATLAGGGVVVVGGQTASGATATVERLQESGSSLGVATVTTHQALNVARYAHSATRTNNDTIIVIGGFDATGVPTGSVEKVDLAPKAGATTPAPMTPAGPTPALPTPGAITPGGMTPGATPPGTGVTTPPAGSGTTPPASGSSGSGGLLGGLLGGGSGGSSSMLNTVLNAALQALTTSQAAGTGFSGFMQAFTQNLLSGVLGGSGSGGLGSLLSGLLGGSGSGATGGSGLSSLLSGLLGGGGGSGATGGSGGGLSGLLGSLFGGGSGSGATGGSSSGGLGGLLGSLFGGGSGGSTGGSATPPPPPANPSALTIQSMTPGQGAVGDTVVLTGINFGSSVTVAFNGTPAAISAATINGAGVVTVTCSVPAAATTGMVTVTSGGMTANAGVFTVQ